MQNFDPFASEASAFDDYTTSEEVAAPAASNQPIVQWMHKTSAWRMDERRPGGRGEEILTKGWHIERGRWPATDAVCVAAGIPAVIIHHSSSGNTAVHWQLKTAHFFILARRLYSLDEMRDTEKRAGVAYLWPYGQGKQMAFQAVVAELLAGYEALGVEPEPLQVSVRKTVCNYLQDALLTQYRVLKCNNLWLASAHNRAIAAGKIAADAPTPRTPFSAFSLGLEPGEEVEARQGASSAKAKGGASQGFLITTIRSTVPAMDPYLNLGECKEYLLAHRCPPTVRAIIEERRDEAIAWSLELTRSWAAEVADAGTGDEPAPLGDNPEDYAPAAPAPEMHTRAAPAAQEPVRQYKTLADVPGEALLAQREGLLRLGQADAAWRQGLGRQEAGKLIVEAQRR